MHRSEDASCFSSARPVDRVKEKLACRPYRGGGEGNPKRLVEAASPAFPTRFEFLDPTGTRSHALGPAKENNHSVESLDGYISVGLLGVKMEIPVKELLQSSLH